MAFIFGLLYIILGISCLRYPEFFWKLQHYFSVEGGQPSEFYFILAKIVGIVLIGAGIMWFALVIFI